jgi:hypothetical protein
MVVLTSDTSVSQRHPTTDYAEQELALLNQRCTRVDAKKMEV